MKRLLILSGKGGTGKTITAAAFIRFSQTKAIADCDVDAPNLHLVYQQPKIWRWRYDCCKLDRNNNQLCTYDTLWFHKCPTVC